MVVIRVPNLSWLCPNILDRYISAIYLRAAAISFAALLGIFYIGTFIDKSEQLFKGQTTRRHGAAAARVHDAAVRLLRHPAGGAPQRAGDVRAPQPVERAVGHEGLRHQPLPDRRAAADPVARLERDPVRPRAAASSRAPTSRSSGSTRRSGAGPPRTSSPLSRTWLIGRDGDIYHYTRLRPADQGAPEPRDLPAGEDRLAARKPAVHAAGDLHAAASGSAPAAGSRTSPGAAGGPRSPSARWPSSRPITSRRSSRSPR